jgi:hypothetical protein
MNFVRTHFLLDGFNTKRANYIRKAGRIQVTHIIHFQLAFTSSKCVEEIMCKYSQYNTRGITPIKRGKVGKVLQKAGFIGKLLDYHITREANEPTRAILPES